MNVEYTARLELDDLNAILARRGLLPGGRVQAVVDEAVLRYCAPKVPFDTGYLIRQALQASAIGYGMIVYGTPYARYLYYGEVYGPNIPILEAGALAGFYSPPGQRKHPTGRALTYQGAPERGAYWFERMLPEHRGDIVREAAAAAGGKAKT